MVMTQAALLSITNPINPFYAEYNHSTTSLPDVCVDNVTKHCVGQQLKRMIDKFLCSFASHVMTSFLSVCRLNDFVS